MINTSSWIIDVLLTMKTFSIAIVGTWNKQQNKKNALNTLARGTIASCQKTAFVIYTSYLLFIKLLVRRFASSLPDCLVAYIFHCSPYSCPPCGLGLSHSLNRLVFHSAPWCSMIRSQAVASAAQWQPTQLKFMIILQKVRMISLCHWPPRGFCTSTTGLRDTLR